MSEFNIMTSKFMNGLQQKNNKIEYLKLYLMPKKYF
jgi:hypothetical protein